MKPSWHSGRVMLAIIGAFDWWQNTMMTEVAIDGSKADLVFISKAGYATEIEIKVSLSDWNADQKKRHWKQDRKHISRFFYAIPETLQDKIPAWIPEGVGIIVVYDRGVSPCGTLYEYDGVRTIRDATRKRCEKIPQQMIDGMYKNCYYRFWRQQLDMMRRRIHADRKKQGVK